MGVTSPTTLAILFGVIGLYIVSRLVRAKGNALPLPPGPKGTLFVGNINDMPKPGVLEAHHWLKHRELYGPISSVTVMGQTIVIINDPALVFELMRDRSTIHSSRPSQIFSGDIVGWKNATAMIQYNETWKIHRKNITKVASTNASVTMFDKVQEAESAHFLLNLLDSPDDLFAHIRKEAGTVILKVTYGYTAKAHGADPLVDLAGRAMQGFAEATVPGRWLVDMVPFLRYLPDGFPGTSFKGTGRAMKDTLSQCVEQPYAFVKQQIREKRHKTSFLSQAIENIGTDAEMEFIHKWAALALFTGGADTTVSSLMTFFLAMMVFPDVQRKAQEELDHVIGGSRLPVSADRDDLPYIMATMKETHRWHPVAPMGLPHTSTAEDTCNGYRIPKGAMLMPNTWWFTHDPSVYPDPMTFRPERFIATPTHTPEPDPRNFIFGYGRRICPGRYVADNALFITIAQTLSVFNVSKPVDEIGNVVEPKLEFEPGMVSHPVPYKAQIKPRSEKHEALIKSSEEIYPWEESDARELETVRW
ncbi:cytochrome P450, partial [Pleomassaria siparia CBS 279.74]